MNKTKTLLIFFIFCFFGGANLKAQLKEGVIQFEYRMDMHRNIPPEQEDLKKMIPQHRIENYQLFFNQSESHYKQVEDDDAVLAAGQSGGRGFRMRMPKTETYTNKLQKEIISLQEFMGKNYLIAENLELIPWKMGNEFMEIAGYVCHMAYYTDSLTKSEVTAWFTVQIQPFLGPDRYATLPGTILALDINNGERVWVARSVEARALKNGEIRKPEKGEKITREAYRALVEEQMQKMGARPGTFRF